MRIRLSRFFSSAFLCVSILTTGLACTEPERQADPLVQVTDAQAFANAYCAAFTECCEGAQLSTDGKGCRAMLAPAVASAPFNQTEAKRCIDGIDAAKADGLFCRTLAGDVSSCKKVFASSGSKQPGEACESDCAPHADGPVECLPFNTLPRNKINSCVLTKKGFAGSSACVATVRGNATLPRTTPLTGPAPTQGYVCEEADGLFCDEKSEACALLKSAGTECKSTEECEKETFCHFATQRCSAKQPEGGACYTGSNECADGLYCHDRVCTRAKAVAGGACTEDAECLSTFCMNRVCSASNPSLAYVCGR